MFGAALALSVLAATAIDVIDDLKHEHGLDPLTSLRNRRGFDEIADGQPPAVPLAVILADLDHFKAINDTFGHAAGDKVLRAFATILSGAVRRDDLVSRIGGEEFVILLPGTELAAAAALAERIRRQVEAASLPALPADREVTASFGVAAAAAGRDRARPGRPRRPAPLCRQAGGAQPDRGERAGRLISARAVPRRPSRPGLPNGDHRGAHGPRITRLNSMRNRTTLNETDHRDRQETGSGGRLSPHGEQRHS